MTHLGHRGYSCFAMRHERKAVTKISSALPGSLCLDIGSPDHRAPLFGFFCQEHPDFGGRHWDWHVAKTSKPDLHSSISEGGLNFLVKSIDDFGRSVLGCAKSSKEARCVTRQVVANGGEVRPRLGTHRGSHCQRAQPASPDV